MEASDADVHHVLVEVVLCAVGRVTTLPADGDDGAKHFLARAGDELTTASRCMETTTIKLLTVKLIIFIHHK